MIVISENSFFHLGVSALVERMALNTTRNLIVFDTGRDCLYMLDTEEAKMPFFHEPILIFSHCRRIYLTEKNRKFKIETLLSKTKSHPAVRRKREVLTVSELRVIKKVCQGISQRRIAEQFKVSEKTISNQKMNALRKLSINKTTKFFVEYLAWLRLRHEYVEYKNNQMRKPVKLSVITPETFTKRRSEVLIEV